MIPIGAHRNSRPSQGRWTPTHRRAARRVVNRFSPVRTATDAWHARHAPPCRGERLLPSRLASFHTIAAVPVVCHVSGPSCRRSGLATALTRAEPRVSPRRARCDKGSTVRLRLPRPLRGSGRDDRIARRSSTIGLRVKGQRRNSVASSASTPRKSRVLVPAKGGVADAAGAPSAPWFSRSLYNRDRGPAGRVAKIRIPSASSMGSTSERRRARSQARASAEGSSARRFSH